MTEVTRFVAEMRASWWLALLMGGCLAVFPFSGTRPLMDTSEARYAEVAREMAVEGFWLVPHSAHTPLLTKPPVAYWAVAVPLKLLGHSEFSARMANGLLFLATVFATAHLARFLYGGQVIGPVAGWIQLLSIFPLAAANVITSDTPLTTVETCGVLCLWGCLRQDSPGKVWAWRMAFYLVFAVAFLTKGFAGFLPLAPAILFAVTAGRHLPWSRLWSLGGLASLIALSLSWYVAVLIKMPCALDIWYHETVTNVFENANHATSRWAYLAILALGSLPGSIVLARTRLHRPQPETVYLLYSIVIPLVVFMLSKTRLPLYVLPLFPPISILCARTVAERWSGSLAWRDVPVGIRWAMAGMLIAAPATRLVSAYAAPAIQADKDFRPTAMAIADDAARQHARPELVLTMPFEGHGLLYYLDGPPVRRVLAQNGDERRTAMAAVFKQPVRSGFRQYIVLTQSSEKCYMGLFDAYVTPIGSSRKWTVWRRDSNACTQVALPTAKSGAVTWDAPPIPQSSKETFIWK